MSSKYEEGLKSYSFIKGGPILTDVLLSLSESKPIQDLEIRKIWNSITYSTVDQNKLLSVKTHYPIIVLKEERKINVGLFNDKHTIYTVLDGKHRLIRAAVLGRTKVKVRILTLDEIIPMWKENYGKDLRT